MDNTALHLWVCGQFFVRAKSVTRRASAGYCGSASGYALAWEFVYRGGILLLLAAGPTVLGFGLYNVSLVYLPSSVVNVIATLEPAFTAVIAYVILGERLTGIQVVGSLLVLGGVVFLRVYGD